MPDLFAERKELLFRTYDAPCTTDRSDTVIGLPRVLSLWDNAPFWTTLLRALGFSVRLSRESTRELYESGLSAVSSDTVCFPAKLAHGHIRDLVSQGVTRILMPTVTTVPTENRSRKSVSMCAVVKGYPMVLRNTDNAQDRWGIPFDNPLFHWYTLADRNAQLTRFFLEDYRQYGITADELKHAYTEKFEKNMHRW